MLYWNFYRCGGNTDKWLERTGEALKVSSGELPGGGDSDRNIIDEESEPDEQFKLGFRKWWSLDDVNGLTSSVWVWFFKEEQILEVGWAVDVDVMFGFGGWSGCDVRFIVENRLESFWTAFPGLLVIDVDSTPGLVRGVMLINLLKFRY